MESASNLSPLFRKDKREDPAPPPGILISGYYKRGYGYSCYRSAGTKDWLIMYTLSGVGRVQSDGQIQSCTAGDVAILPPGSLHDYFTAENSTWEFVWAHFIPRPGWSVWLQLPKAAKGILFLPVRDGWTRNRIHAAFERMIFDNQNASEVIREELGMNALEEILLFAFASLETDGCMRVLDLRVQEVMNMLSKNMAEEHSVNELARKVKLSPSRLAHLFKEQVGDSIIETLLKMRLRQSARLLRFTSRRVWDIAADVGFRSPDYFSRAFTSYFGLSPRAYRKRFDEQ